MTIYWQRTERSDHQGRLPVSLTKAEVGQPAVENADSCSAPLTYGHPDSVLDVCCEQDVDSSPSQSVQPVHCPNTAGAAPHSRSSASVMTQHQVSLWTANPPRTELSVDCSKPSLMSTLSDHMAVPPGVSSSNPPPAPPAPSDLPSTA